MAKKKPVDLENDRPVFEGLSQYCPPHCFELAGRELKLVMDNGYDYLLRFGRETVSWGVVGEEPRTDAYVAHKADDTTFFINAEIAGATPRTGIVLILDDENALVTAVVTHQGLNPKFPYMIDLRLEFGAVEIEGQPLNPRRHGYTEDMLGKAAYWDYGEGHQIIHVYSSAHYYNVIRPSEAEADEKGEPWTIAHEGYPEATEPAWYVKIKDGIYLFTFIEEHLERMTGPTTRGNSLAFLMNLKRMTDVGRSFGHNAQQQPENYCFGAFGRFVPVPKRFRDLKSVYYV
jgi:hypothetical protein